MADERSEDRRAEIQARLEVEIQQHARFDPHADMLPKRIMGVMEPLFVELDRLSRERDHFESEFLKACGSWRTEEMLKQEAESKLSALSTERDALKAENEKLSASTDEGRGAQYEDGRDAEAAVWVEHLREAGLRLDGDGMDYEQARSEVTELRERLSALSRVQEGLRDLLYRVSTDRYTSIPTELRDEMRAALSLTPSSEATISGEAVEKIAKQFEAQDDYTRAIRPSSEV